MADMTAPPAPTQVTASVGADDRERTTMLVSWMDNCDFADEYVTVFTFRDTSGIALVTAAVHALHYDVPAGSTGPRTANVLIPMRTGATIVYAQTVRLVTLDNGQLQCVWSPKSVRAAIGATMNPVLPVPTPPPVIPVE